MRNAQIMEQARHEEARISAAALFGMLTEGDRRERSLIGEILSAAHRLSQHVRTNPDAWRENRLITQRAAALLLYQDREDPLHTLGSDAVSAWQQGQTAGQPQT